MLDKNSYFILFALLITWCPNRAIITTAHYDSKLSAKSTPAGGLLHEFLHLSNFLTDFKCYSDTYKKQTNDGFHNDQEREVIDLIHNFIVPELKRIGIKNPPDQISHEGKAYYVEDVLSYPKL